MTVTAVDTYMTLEQAAEANPHLSYYTLRDAVTSGTLTHLRKGPKGKRGVLLTQTWIDDWLACKIVGRSSPDSPQQWVDNLRAQDAHGPDLALLAGTALPRRTRVRPVQPGA